MRERPIFFNSDMVRAILSGRKTQTRRVMKIQPPSDRHRLVTCVCSSDKKYEGKLRWSILDELIEKEATDYFNYPYGGVGDRLWVRETYTIATGNGQYPVYKADAVEDDSGERNGFWVGDDFYSYEGTRRWFPSIHMPKQYSRITLEITGVRTQRLRDITEEQAIAEGMIQNEFGWSWREGVTKGQTLQTARMAFANLWNHLADGPNWNLKNPEGEAWMLNPMVWVIEFRMVR